MKVPFKLPAYPSVKNPFLRLQKYVEIFNSGFKKRKITDLLNEFGPQIHHYLKKNRIDYCHITMAHRGGYLIVIQEALSLLLSTEP